MAQADAPIDAFYGDRAYGQWKVYGRLAAAAIEAIIPPRKNAALLLDGQRIVSAVSIRFLHSEVASRPTLVEQTCGSPR